MAIIKKICSAGRAGIVLRICCMVAVLCMVFGTMPVRAAADDGGQRRITPIPVNTNISNINGGEPVFFAYLDGYYYRCVVDRGADGYVYNDIVRYRADGSGATTRLNVNVFNGTHVKFEDKFLIYQNYIYYAMRDSYDVYGNNQYSAIVRMNMDGSGKTIIYSVAPYFERFSIWKGRIICHTMQGLVSSNMSGGDVRVLSTHSDMTVHATPNSTEPYSVLSGYVLDRGSDYIYFVTFRDGLYRAKYDGSTRDELVSPFANTGKLYGIHFADKHRVGLSSGSSVKVYENGTLTKINPDNRKYDRRDRFSGNSFNFYYCGRIYYHDIYGRVASCLTDGSQKELLTTGNCCTTDHTLGVADDGAIACLYRIGDKMLDLSDGMGGYAPPKGLAGSDYSLVTELEEGMEVYISPDASGKYRIGGASSDKAGLVAKVSTIGEKFRFVSESDGTFYLQSTKTDRYLTANSRVDASPYTMLRPTYQYKHDDISQRFVFVPSGNGAFYIETLGGFPISGENKLKGKVFHGSPHNAWCLLTEK